MDACKGISFLYCKSLKNTHGIPGLAVLLLFLNVISR